MPLFTRDRSDIKQLEQLTAVMRKLKAINAIQYKNHSHEDENPMFVTIESQEHFLVPDDFGSAQVCNKPPGSQRK
jgi:hypothetical protein